EVEGLAHDVVRGALQAQALPRCVTDPASEIGATGQQEGNVKKAGRSSVARKQACIAIEDEQGGVAGPERRRPITFVQLPQAKYPLVKGRDGLEIAHLQVDRTDSHGRGGHVEDLGFGDHAAAPEGNWGSGLTAGPAEVMEAVSMLRCSPGWRI